MPFTVLGFSVADRDPETGSFSTPGSGIRNRYFSGSRIPDRKPLFLRAFVGLYDWAEEEGGDMRRHCREIDIATVLPRHVGAFHGTRVRCMLLDPIGFVFSTKLPKEEIPNPVHAPALPRN